MDVTDLDLAKTAWRTNASSGACNRASQVIGRIGDRWSMFVIIKLRERGHRFNELKRSIDGISQRMLTLTLRNLERDGIVKRKVTPLIPPRVDYELTDMGHSLALPVEALGMWVYEHLEPIGLAQAEFDAEVAAKAA